jgi:hypothetical protein
VVDEQQAPAVPDHAPLSPQQSPSFKRAAADQLVTCPVCSKQLNLGKFTKHFNNPTTGHCRLSNVPVSFTAEILRFLREHRFGVCRRHEGRIYALNDASGQLLCVHGENGSKCKQKRNYAAATVDEANTPLEPELAAPASPPGPQLDDLRNGQGTRPPMRKNHFDAICRQALIAWEKSIRPETGASLDDQTEAWEAYKNLNSSYVERGNRVFHVDTLADHKAKRKARRAGQPTGRDKVWQALFLAGTGFPGRAADRLQSDSTILDPELPWVKDALQSLNLAVPYEDHDLPDLPLDVDQCFPAKDIEENRKLMYDIVRDKAQSTGKGLDGCFYARLIRQFDCKGDPERINFETPARLIGHILRGCFDTPDLRPMVAELVGYGLSKPGRPFAARPLGVALCLVRLGGAWIVKKFKDRFEQQLGAHDFGSYVEGGPQSLFATIDTLRQLHPDWGIVKLDIKNAFNTLPRRLLFQWVRQFPELIPWFRTFYGGVNKIHVRNVNGKAVFTALSAEGVIQGMAESGVAFDLIFCSLVNLVRRRHPDVVILTLHDDSYIMGLPAAISKCYEDLFTTLLEHHLIIEPSKSALWIPRADWTATLIQATLIPGLANTVSFAAWADHHAIPCVSSDPDPAKQGIMVGGLPIGSPAYVDAFLRKATASATSLVRTIVDKYAEWPMDSTFPTLHGLFTVLRMCVSSKVLHIVRGLPPAVTRPFAREIDEAQLRGLLILIGRVDLAAIPADTWPTRPDLRALRLRIFLWLDSGGMGIMELVRIAAFAYVGSWRLLGERVGKAVGVRTRSPEAITAALEPLSAALNEVRLSNLTDTVIDKLPASARDLLLTEHSTGYQHTLSRAESAWLQSRIFDNLAPDSQARAIWLSVSASESGAGLASLPLEKDLGLNDQTFRDDVGVRLGIAPAWFAALPSTFKCPLCSVPLSNTTFTHPLVCRFAGTGQRHTPVVAALAAELHSGLSRVGVHVDCRKTGYMHHGLVPQHPLPKSKHDISQHSADIALTEIDTRPILVDPTVVTPSVGTSHLYARKPVGSKAKEAEDMKEAGLSSRFHRPEPPTVTFWPFAVETFGRFGPRASEFVKFVARKAHPPDQRQDGGDWDVDGLMARFTGRIRAHVQVGRARGLEAQFLKFRHACIARGLI